MIDVLITKTLPDKVLDAARQLANVTVRDTEASVDRAEAQEILQRYDAIIPTLGDDFSAASFAGLNAPRCKLLANFGVGFNHIDIVAARTVGVQVTNTPGAVTDATADIAVMLMLMTCRRAGEGERMVRAGQWGGWQPTQMLGTHMSGKTLGIVGMGRIGQAIAQRCRLGFGMTVNYVNRSVKPVDGCTQLPDLAALMAVSDIVALALPGGAETRHTIDASALAAMKPGGFLVNIARGDVMDEAALIAALQSGHLAGAGLDVYEHEPHVPEALCQMENVTLLPHLGTAALEVREDMGMMAVDNLQAHLAGKPLPNLL